MRSPAVCWLLSCGVSLALSAAQAEDPAKTTNRFESAARPPSEETSVRTERYLGVVTEPISEPLAAQLKSVLPAGGGLLVKRVLPASPAAKAGVQPFDILASADSKPLTTPDRFKDQITSQPAGQPLKLEVIRGAKVQVIDVVPGDRTVSRLVHRHFGPTGKGAATESIAGQTGAPAAAETPAYSVGVQTRDGRHFQVDVRLASETRDAETFQFAGVAPEIALRIKSLPEPIQRSVQRQIAGISQDRETLRTVQFRFQPQRDGNRQILSVTLRKPQSNGAVKSFELQQPMGDVTQPVSLEQVLNVPDFAAQLKDLDPAVREKIASTLKTASLPAGTFKVESSQ
jgi:hypothetical protein